MGSGGLWSAGGGHVERAPGGEAASAVLSAIAFGFGLWLSVSPFAFGHGVVADRFTAGVSDVLTGALVLVVALVGMMAPREAPWSGPVLCAAGLWVAVTPVVVGYGQAVGGVAAVNSLVVGGALAVLGGVAALVLRRT